MVVKIKWELEHSAERPGSMSVTSLYAPRVWWSARNKWAPVPIGSSLAAFNLAYFSQHYFPLLSLFAVALICALCFHLPSIFFDFILLSQPIHVQVLAFSNSSICI